MGRFVMGAARWVVRYVKSYRSTTPLREQLLTGVVMCIGTVIAIGGFFAIESYSGTAARHEFEGPATRFAATLSDAVDGYVELVDSAGALFTESEEVTRWQFFEFAGEKQADYPGLRALQWIPWVSHRGRGNYENLAAADGIVDFRFMEQRAGGKIVRAAKRKEYLPVYYVEPFEGNERALGVDLAADPLEMKVLERARDEGVAVATRRPVPAGVPGAEAEFMVTLAVYRSETAPFTVAERRKRLVGFVRGIYRIGALIDGALPGLTAPPGLDIYLFDQDDAGEGRLFYYHPSPLRPDVPEPLSEEEALSGLYNAIGHGLAGWRWTIVVKPVPSNFTRIVDSAPWGFLGFMLLFTTLLVQYLIHSQARRGEIERSVTERTSELESEITERRRIETELRSAKDQAEIANRAKSEFLAMMSHELRTPLNAVIGFAEIMSEQMFGSLGSEQYRRYAEDIHMSGKHLLSLINDLLDLSKIEAKQFELHEEDFDVAEAWRTVQSILQENIARSRLELEAEVSESLPRLRADKRAFRQILINLLSNAMKFTPEGGRITMTAAVAPDGEFRFSVADTGIGIAHEDLEAVLQPFKQVDSSLARKYEGTGLGLPLTHRLIQMHGGTLDIESALGVGTTVTVTLPKERLVTARAPKTGEPGKVTVLSSLVTTARQDAEPGPADEDLTVEAERHTA